MESILAIVALISLVLFVYSFLYDFDPVSIFLHLTVSEERRKKVRMILGIIALISTTVFVLYSIMN